MATYDPEAVRSRPTAPTVSPLDDLLDGVSHDTETSDSELNEESTKDVHEESDFENDQNKELFSSNEDFRPFEVPPVESVDESVGRVMRTLQRLQLERNTLVIFTSDNGGQVNVGANNGPLRDGNCPVYEFTGGGAGNVAAGLRLYPGGLS